MARFFALLALCAAPGLHAVVLRDVPLGECHECEVTCFEDCAFKFKREIMSTDSKKSLLQLSAPVEKQSETSGLTPAYNECIAKEKCTCRQFSNKSKDVALLAADAKKCAVGEMSCSSKCAGQVIENDIAAMQKQVAKTGLLQKKGFPLHSVKINAFSTGKLKLDHCLKYCLAATCGCNDAAGFNSADDMTAAAAAAGGSVVDTPKSPQYRLAKIEECAKGMMGKKVNKNLFIKIDGGPGGMYEVCTGKFLTKLMGPGDHSKVQTRCDSMASEDEKYGCLWDNDKQFCHVGFSPILRCQVQYFDDATL